MTSFSCRVDELYRFLNSWVAHIYGDLDEDALKARGFELIQHDTEWANNRTSSKVRKIKAFESFFQAFCSQDGGDIGDEVAEYTRESWEVSRWNIFLHFPPFGDDQSQNDVISDRKKENVVLKKKFSFYLFFYLRPEWFANRTRILIFCRISFVQLLKAPFVKTFNIIKSQTGSNDFEGLEVRRMQIEPENIINRIHNNVRWK